MGLHSMEADPRGKPWNRESKNAWKRIHAGPKAPGWWEEFSLENLITTKDSQRECWWVNNIEFDERSKNTRVVGLPISNTGGDLVMKMMMNPSIPTQSSMQRKVKDMLENHECTLSDVQRVASTGIIVPLTDPVSRILSGIQEHLNDNHPVQGHNKDYARKAFSHQMKNADFFINALRDVKNGYHKVAMAVTHCHDCQNYMLPVQGFYLRDTDQATSVPIRYVCTCQLTEMIDDVAKELGVEVQHNQTSSRKYKVAAKQTLSLENRQWIEETYAADLALYKEQCGKTCGDA